MIHYTRSVLWIASILYLGEAIAEDKHVCACLHHEQCSQLISGKLPIDDKVIQLVSPCKEPGTVYCCGASTVDKQKVLDMAKVVGQELDRDHQLVKIIDDLIEHVGNDELNSKEKETTRQEKSIGGSERNGLNLDNKLYDKKLDKLIIVYPQNNTKNIEDEKDNLQIVLPISEQKDETLKDVDDGESTPESYKIVHSVKQSQVKLPPTLHVHKSIAGNSKLHRLFPKRRVIPSTTKSEESTQNKENDSNDNDDLEISASEVDEISTQILSEKTIKRPRPPPRHFVVRQQGKNEGSRQKGKSVHDFFRDRSKNTTGLPEMQPNLNKIITSENITTANIPKEIIAENINLMVVNDIMKTNYSGQHASRLHGSTNNLRHQPHTITVASETEEQSDQKAASNAESSLNENRQTLTPRTTQVTEEGNNTSVLRKRLHMRRPGLRTQQAATNQEQTTENTSRKPSPRDSPRKSLLSQRTGVAPVYGTKLDAESTSIPQPIQNNSQDRKTTQIAQRLKAKSTEATPVFGARTSRFRQRPSHAETTTVTGVQMNKNIKEPTQGTSPVTAPVSEFKLSEVYSEQTTVPLQQDASEASQDLYVETQDLESSGTNNHQSRVLFHPPTEMTAGFQPMIVNIQDLKTVGPLPGGFFEQSMSFDENPDGFGLSLPSDGQPRSMSQSFDDFDYNSMLLPPVFLPPQHRAETESTPMSNDEFETASLLPPVQLPMPLMKEMLSDRATITKIQDEFNVLKSQYDLLLNRYAETLRQYNDEYEKIIGSKTSTES